MTALPGARAANAHPGVVVVAGPTAGGKSALALALAEALAREGRPAVLVNGDAMQVYRELAVLTARPDADARARVSHRLYGVVPAAEACSAGRWRALALAEIAAAHAAGRLPIVVGGSGLYLDALAHGLAPVPPVPAAVRARADARHAELGARAFHAELAARDPASAALRAADTQRVKRAWAVLEATGRPLAVWRAEAHAPLACPLLRILVAPPRAALYRACDARFAAMMAAGALAEVRALEALALNPALPAMKALGVPELRAHLAGAIGRGEAVARAQRATRRYAKRQMTWFRRRYAAAVTIAEGPPPPAAAVEACHAAVRRVLLAV